MGRVIIRKPTAKNRCKGAPRTIAPAAEVPDYVLKPKSKLTQLRKPLSQEQKDKNKVARQNKTATDRLNAGKGAVKKKGTLQKDVTKKVKLSWPQKMRDKMRAVSLASPSFQLAGGTCIRATKMVADKGTYDPVCYLIDGLPAFYNTVSGLYCFSQYGHWFFASDYREGVSVMAQNPNSNGARHPIDITSPWYFLSADPDTTFTLQKREYKVNQRVIDAEPQVRPLWFNKCSGKTTAALAISDEEMSDDAEELWEKKMVVKMNTSEDPVVRSRSIKELKRMYWEEKKREESMMAEFLMTSPM